MIYTTVRCNAMFSFAPRAFLLFSILENYFSYLDSLVERTD